MDEYSAHENVCHNQVRDATQDRLVRKSESIKFSLLSESEIRNVGVVDVYQAAYYDRSGNPIANGLLDPKMGVANRDDVCATCYGKIDDCPGHYGCLTLALPVFNIGYFGAILEILKCICKFCSRVLLDEKECRYFLQEMRNVGFDSLSKIELKKQIVQKCSEKTIKCWRCGNENGKVKKDKKSWLTIVHEWPRTEAGMGAYISTPKPCPGEIYWVDCLFVYLSPSKRLTHLFRLCATVSGSGEDPLRIFRGGLQWASREGFICTDSRSREKEYISRHPHRGCQEY